SDLSVYMSNYDVFKSIDEYCLSLNQPNYKKNIKNDELLFQIYSIEFILWYANKNRTNADLICN
ncbi:MAG: hypothetical protein ACC656_00275, partial [Candidatus Heimdallarchaeota archaeon]